MSVPAMQASPSNILDLTRPQLQAVFADWGERPYRADQVMKWIYHAGLTSFDGMTDISKGLRSRLADHFEIRVPEVVDEQVSTDGTYKWVVRTDNGDCVETVLIPDRGRNTLCVSSQVGCVLDCSFCSTGKQGFNGNLSAAEIFGQLVMAERARRPDPVRDGSRWVTNVVLMGMGEPLLNFDNAVAATSLMMDDLAYGISKRRVTISTAGVVPAIYRLAEVTDVSLAVSLHAANDELRNELVPINRRYPLAELLAACRHYGDCLGERRVVTFEYTLIRGVNDSLADARALARLLRDLPCKINLIPFNPFPHSAYERPTMASVRAFQTCLMKLGYPAMLRTTRGDDISAACGQLVGQVQDRTRRHERHVASWTGIAAELIH